MPAWPGSRGPPTRRASSSAPLCRPGLQPILADAEAVRSMIVNLLGHALRTTRPGGQVIVSTGRSAAGDVVLRIRDSGEGLNEKAIEAALQTGRAAPLRPLGREHLGRRRPHLGSGARQGACRGQPCAVHDHQQAAPGLAVRGDLSRPKPHECGAGAGSALLATAPARSPWTASDNISNPAEMG